MAPQNYVDIQLIDGDPGIRHIGPHTYEVDVFHAKHCPYKYHGLPSIPKYKERSYSSIRGNSYGT
jgi:hypothetical protein